jgi:hypothetical protein
MTIDIVHLVPPRNKANDSQDVSSWRPTVVGRPLSLAGRFVIRRCRVTPDVAEVIAALAGLGSEVRS